MLSIEAQAHQAGECLSELPTAEFIESDQFTEEEGQRLTPQDWLYIDSPAYFVRAAAQRIANKLQRSVLITEHDLTAWGDWHPTGHSFIVEASA